MSTQQVWYLEGAIDESGQVFRMPVSRVPFRIGREPGLELSLPSQVVSSHHAELQLRGERLIVIDHGSTNGTFVNKMAVEGEATLEDGDTLQVATLSFRIRLAEADAIDPLISTTATIDTREAVRLVENQNRLRALIEQEAVTQLLQPIVDLADDRVLGFEVLGRGNLDGLTVDIGELFRLAQPIGAAVDLSLLLRRRSVATCATLEGDYCFFLNTHPAELHDDSLVESLRETRRNWPDLRIAVEIHETAVTDAAGIRELQKVLNDLDMLLVYDDFGAGQARLVELAEVPPAYLKFDRSLIRQVHNAPAARISLLEGLVRMALEMEIEIIAEGIECQAEADLCRQLGFGYGQGFFLARPFSARESNVLRIAPRVE